MLLMTGSAMAHGADPSPKTIEKIFSKYPANDRPYYSERWQGEFRKVEVEIGRLRVLEVRIENELHNPSRISYGPSPLVTKSQEVRGQILELERYRSKLLSTSNPFIGELEFDDFKVGRVGTFPHLRIVDVDGNVVIAKLPKRKGFSDEFKIVGFDTTGLKPGQTTRPVEVLFKVLGQRDGMWVVGKADPDDPFERKNAK